MRLGFVIDNRRCIGCHACTVACKSEHATPVGVNRTWVKYVEKGTFPHTRRFFSVHRCNHCEDAPCVTICPVRSLFTRPDGIVDFDRDRCIGCKACMQACPYDSLHIDPERHTSTKCNFCAHRLDVGLEPACVIVCPAQAILHGDLDDPTTKITSVLDRNVATVRKPEKNTKPKLFYIESDGAPLRPDMAPPGAYGVTRQSGGVGHFAGKPAAVHSKAQPHSTDMLSAAGASLDARRIYDTPQKGILWDWEVSGYLWTKSIAAGVLFVPLLLETFGWLTMRPKLEMVLALLSLIFLGLTGMLLVKDLDRPTRFLYVLLRPQWKSWLVRGAYIINAFGALTTLWLALVYFGPGGGGILRFSIAVLGIATAVYTAFLLGQAKGRDLWQSPLSALRMLITATLTGSSMVLLLWLMAGEGIPLSALWVLRGALAVHLLITLTELLTPPVTTDTALAHHIMVHGPLKQAFWSGVVGGGVVPLVLVMLGGSGLLVLPAAVLVLIFAAVSEHVWIRAPQLVPLS